MGSTESLTPLIFSLVHLHRDLKKVAVAFDTLVSCCLQLYYRPKQSKKKFSSEAAFRV